MKDEGKNDIISIIITREHLHKGSLHYPRASKKFMFYYKAQKARNCQTLKTEEGDDSQRLLHKGFALTHVLRFKNFNGVEAACGNPFPGPSYT